MISVLMCDDHLIVRQGLRQILADTDDIVVTAECDNGADALRAVREQRFDVVLLDIAMPQRDGLDVLVQIKREAARQPVLMLSTYPDKQYAGRCFRLGAAGYLNKRAGADLLTSAIRKVATGGIFVAPGQAEMLAMALSQASSQAPHEGLSRREYQVFELIAAGHSVGDIAGRLAISPNTVSTYRSRILDKTGAQNDVGIAMYAVRHQLVEM